MTNQIIAKTIVGSHVWKMNHKDSDTDYFIIYKIPTHKILDGSINPRSQCKIINDDDITLHEVGHVVNMLLKGNINFIIGVLSPLVIEQTKSFKELQQLTRQHLSKNIYHSIHGLATSNYKKFIESGKDNTEKKRNTIARTLNFGISILEGSGPDFAPATNWSEKEIEILIESFTITYNNSKLPEKPPEKPFRNWLLKTRIETDPISQLWDNKEDECWDEYL